MLYNFERHVKSVHFKIEYPQFMKEKEAIEKKYKTQQKETIKSTKRPAETSSSSSTTTQNIFGKKRKANIESFNQRSISSMLNKEPVLSLCGAMVVESGQPFSYFDSNSMQMMMYWGKLGVGDESSAIPNSSKVREKVQLEAIALRKMLKKELEGKVLSLSSDMASKDGRCFLGETFYCTTSD